jgi:hypothetical protein
VVAAAGPLGQSRARSHGAILVCSQNLIKRKINILREIARTLRSNVKRLALTFWQEEFTFCRDRPNSLILKMERILGNHTSSKPA